MMEIVIFYNNICNITDIDITMTPLHAIYICIILK